VTRFPQDSIPSVKLLLGGDGDSEQSELHSRLFSTCPQIKRDYPVEEILSMQFNFAKELAQQELLANSKEEVIRDTIITVPGWFGQTERRRILDAAEISGLKVLNLINDGTAVAINYAMTRQFSPDRPQHHLIYDLGAGSLKVSLVRFKSEMLPDPLSLSNLPSLKNFTTIQVLGYGHDTSVGGYYFDDLIREILIKGFKESQSIDVDVRRDERAMAKLTKESIRVKQVLSANHFASARIEGLIQDLDFDQFSITRQEFEKVLIDKGMKERLIKPIEQAIQDIEDMDMDIDSLIFVGGSSRVPFVQETVSNYLDENTRIKMIAKNVNADEASVLGAGLFGAGLKRGFRTKDLKVLDLYPFPINLRLVDQDQESIAFVGANSEIPFKKTFKFVNQTRDFKLELFDPSNANTLVLSTSINGITTATSNLTGETPCFVEVEVELDQSGLLKIGEASLILRQEEDDDEVKGSGTVTDKLKGLFNKFGNTTNTTADSAPLEEEELERLPRPTRTKLSIETTSRMMMSQSEKSLVRKKLSEVKASLQRKLLREEAKNSLESFIYKVRDLLS
jgi:hypoxia up-regulated 1